MAQSPAFQFYPADYTIGTKFFTPAERGVYVDCLCHQWDEGSVPGDEPRDMAVVMRCSEDEARQLWARVSKKFVRGEDGLWRNERLESERRKQLEYRQSKAEAGRRGGLAKAKQKHSSASGLLVAETKHSQDSASGLLVANELAKASSSSSSSSSSSKEQEQRASLPETTRASRPNPYAHAQMRAPNGNAFWQGPIFDIPDGWARKALKASNGKAAGSTIVLFAQALTARLQRDGSEAPAQNFLGWLDTEWAAYRQPATSSGYAPASEVIARQQADRAQRLAEAPSTPEERSALVREALAAGRRRTS